MKHKLVIGLTAATLCTTAFAQSAFQGFSGQISTGYQSYNASSLNGSIDNTNSLSAPNQQFGGAPLILGLGYNFSVTPKWMLGIGADYSVISQNSSRFSYANSGFDIPDGAQLHGSQVKASNQFNIFITPSYVIDQDKLLYLKAGYSAVQAEFQAPTSFSITGSRIVPLGVKFPQSKTSNLNGYILGLGYKQMIHNGFYGFAEASYVGYGSTTYNQTGTSGVGRSTNMLSTSVNLSSYQFLVGIGYQFK